MKTSIYVDADSQFTKEVVPDAPLPALGEQIERLIDHSCVCFGHWEIAQQHDTFVVLLRNMGDVILQEIREHLSAEIREYFGDSGPHLLIYPGDSTSIYLVENVVMDLGLQNRVVVASPAFREYGKYELRLELPVKHYEMFRRNQTVKVLFLDDSRSSGQTEKHAIDALFRERDLIGKKGATQRRTQPKVQWLTYVVLSRGARSAGIATARSASKAKIEDQSGFRSRISSFASIGPESLSHATCPLCSASARVRTTVAWARGARPAVQELIQRLDRLLQVRSIEQPWDPLSPPLSQTRIPHDLLRIEALSMPSACAYIRFARDRWDECSDDESLAALMFCVLHFQDVGSYLASDELSDLLTRTAVRVCASVANISSPVARDSRRDAFMIAMAASPVSLIASVLPLLVQIFAAHNEVDLIGALTALTFSSQYQSLVNPFADELYEYRQHIVSLRQSELSRKVSDALNAPPKDGIIGIRGTADIVAADLTTLCAPPSDKQVTWIARTLSALLQRGKHEGFLTTQLERNAATAIARNGLLQVLDLMEQLPTSVKDGIIPSPTEVKDRIRGSDISDAIQSEDLANQVIDLWEQLRDRHFSTPVLLGAQLRRLIKRAVDEYGNKGVRTQHIRLLANEPSYSEWTVFCPNDVELVSHLENMLMNPLEHFPSHSLCLSSTDPPVEIAYFVLNEESKHMALVIANRARQPENDELFSGRGLTNSRAVMQILGGDLLYMYVKGGLFEHTKYAPSSAQRAALLGDGVDPEKFRNFFITTFPMMYRAM